MKLFVWKFIFYANIFIIYSFHCLSNFNNYWPLSILSTRGEYWWYLPSIVSIYIWKQICSQYSITHNQNKFIYWTKPVLWTLKRPQSVFFHFAHETHNPNKWFGCKALFKDFLIGLYGPMGQWAWAVLITRHYRQVVLFLRVVYVQRYCAKKKTCLGYRLDKLYVTIL